MFSVSAARTVPWSRNASIVARRHRIYRVGTDKLFHVQYVAVRGILRSCARPKQPLNVRALGAQLLPTGAGEQPLVALVGEFCVRYRDLAAQSGQCDPALRLCCFAEACLDQPVYCHVDTAYKEAGDACDPGGVAALRDPVFEAGQIGFDDLFIDMLREQQRDVDVDALANQLADRRQTRLRRRHLDHQVVPTDAAPQPPRLGDGRVGIHREIRRHFQADISVPTFRRLVDRAQRVRGILNIRDREPLIKRHHIAIARAFGRLQSGIVIGAAADGLFEDRRIGGHSRESVGLDKPLEAAFDDETPGKEVEPHGLAKIMQAQERIDRFFCPVVNVHHLDSPLDLSICCFAAASTLAGVKPNFVSRSLSGAEEPNVFMPTVTPVGPT